jgi:hypothetical protein
VADKDSPAGRVVLAGAADGRAAPAGRVVPVANGDRQLSNKNLVIPAFAILIANAASSAFNHIIFTQASRSWFVSSQSPR